MSVFRSANNPIIEPKDLKPSKDNFEIIGVFNAGVARFEDEIILLMRVAERPVGENPNTVPAAVYDAAKGEIVIKEFAKDDPENDFSDPRLIVRPRETYLTSISHLRLARSKDGINFEIEQQPTIKPVNQLESFGLEDPRIGFIDGVYYINYVAVSPLGVTTCLISTKDFGAFERLGVMFCPDNKDVVVFPERIGGKFYALHRPVSPLFMKNDIWIAESEDLLCWGNHRYLMSPVKDTWDEVKIGASAVPFKTEQGWLEIHHGVDKDNRYCLGAVLLDSERPWKIIARTNEPILKPQTDYETEGFFGNVVFTCGLLFEDERLKIYYGVADTAICYAEIPLKDVVVKLKQS